jgi:DNA-binding transcriptional regulator GbsR (MarR family)
VERTPEAERRFAEDLGLLFQDAGGPPMLGRILARLLICDPPEQTASELESWLNASAGAISAGLTLLTATGMVERVRLPGVRATCFRVAPSMGVAFMQQRMALVHRLHEVATQGLLLLADAPPEQQERLRDFRDFYAFLGERMPALFQEWQARRG